MVMQNNSVTTHLKLICVVLLGIFYLQRAVMKKLLFLDFDGVLHSEECDKYFTKLTLFELYLKKLPEVEIVISSSWRELHSLTELKQFFSESLRDRIVGVTPILDCGCDRGGRQREIEAFLSENNLNEDNAAWIALDDISVYFDKSCTYLIKVDPGSGFSNKEGQALFDWYKQTTFIARMKAVAQSGRQQFSF